jgi:hypothetical protein
VSTLLKKALEKVIALPPDEQDPIPSQILASLGITSVILVGSFDGTNDDGSRGGEPPPDAARYGR